MTTFVERNNLFQELVDFWPIKRRNKNGEKQLFDSKITTHEAFEKLMERAKIVVADGTNQTLAMFIAGETQKVSRPVPLVSLYPVEEDSTELLEAFEKIWEFWPRHFSWPENKESAFQGFKSFVKKNGVAGVVETCSFYSTVFNDPTSGMVHPYHLSNFLSDSSKFAEWSARAVFAPNPDELEAFDAVWAWFPKKGSDKQKRDALLFWLRHIKPEQRFDFLAAVKSYRRTIEDIKYSRNLITFIGDWKPFLFYTSIVHDIARAFLEVVPADCWRGKILMDMSTSLSNQILARLQTGDTKGKIQDTIEDVAAVIEYQNKILYFDVKISPYEVYKTALRLAYLPPKAMVR